MPRRTTTCDARPRKPIVEECPSLSAKEIAASLNLDESHDGMPVVAMGYTVTLATRWLHHGYYWTVRCPRCDRKVHRLFTVPGRSGTACITCHHLTYRCNTRSESRRDRMPAQHLVLLDQAAAEAKTRRRRPRPNPESGKTTPGIIEFWPAERKTPSVNRADSGNGNLDPEQGGVE